MVTTSTQQTPLKTPVFVLGGGLGPKLTALGLKSVLVFDKRGNAMKRLQEALGIQRQAVVILQREGWFENSDELRRTTTRLSQSFPDCRILVTKANPFEDERVVRNDIKAGATAVLCHAGNRLGDTDCQRIVTFVTTGNLPPGEVPPAPTPEPNRVPVTPQPVSILPPGKTPSNQELLAQVLANQARIETRLNQIHGIVSGVVIEEIKRMYPAILELLNLESES